MKKSVNQFLYKNRSRNRNRSRNTGEDKGFTLVELVVVLVIIGILAAIGIPTAMHFIKKAEFRKNEENAKTAYLAAESTLTWYRASGEWESFKKEITAGGELNTTFPAGDEKEGRIYAIAVSGSGASSSEAQAMKLLDSGVYSKDFFNASIVIEVDVESGQVYSAFYGTRCEGLTYSETTGDGQLCISAAGDWRSYDTRKEELLGYYSVEDVVNVVELKPVRLKVTTINLINSETLSLNWTSNSRYDNLDVKYVLTFYQKGESGDEKLFTTEVELNELQKYLKTAEEESTGLRTRTGMVNLELRSPSQTNPDEAAAYGTWAFPFTYQQTNGSSGRMSLVLDGMMTAELLKVNEAKAGAGAAPDAVARNANTSITRLGEIADLKALKNPQNIYVEIQAQATYNQDVMGGDVTEYKPSNPVRSNTENTLYAKADFKTMTNPDGTAGSQMEAEISRFRHLSNIRYYDAAKEAEFVLTSRNMDWLTSGVGMYGVVRSPEGGAGVNPDYGSVEWNSVKKGDMIQDFPSVSLLASTHVLKGKGNQTSLVNLHLGTGSIPNDDLIGKLYTDETEKKANLSHYLGLFCEAEGRIEELTLTDPVLYLAKEDGAAAEYFDNLYGIGILCGRNQGSLKNISVKTTKENHQTLLAVLNDRVNNEDNKKPAGIGGLVGVQAGKGADGALTRLTDGTNIQLNGLTMEGIITAGLPNPDKEKSGGSGEEVSGAALGGTGGGAPGAVPGGAGEGGAGTGDGTDADDGADASAGAVEERAKEYAYGIGGIFGYAWIGRAEGAGAGNGVHVENCTNYADVTGNLFTGGIAGGLKGDFTAASTALGSGGSGSDLVSLKDCTNEGLILCNVKEEETGAGQPLKETLEGRYFGGILGFGDGAQITSCVNASKYKETFDDTKKDELLLGRFVGGIIGYGNNSQLAGCSTRKGSWVFGANYVGGIAGGLSNDLQEAITQAADAGVKVTTNAGYVIGNRCVGGIVGKNDGKEQTTITSCINNGVVAGYDRYIGGIVGYNGENGTISDCASYISDYSGSIYNMIVEDWKAAGDCAGGLVGYNNGNVEFSEESENIQVKSVSSIVVGKDYVGGIIGFNDVAGMIDVHYTLVGGQIYGYGNGVGGCIGLNASEKLLETNLVMRPNSVTGKYYVGGCIGANVVNLSVDVAMTGFRSDNSLGSVNGDAFTGGLIGYQRTYTMAQLEKNLDAAGGTLTDLLEENGLTGGAGTGSGGAAEDIGTGAEGNGGTAGNMSAKAGNDRTVEDMSTEASNGRIAGQAEESEAASDKAGYTEDGSKMLLLAYIDAMEIVAQPEDDTLLPLLDGKNVPTQVMASENQNIFTIGDRSLHTGLGQGGGDSDSGMGIAQAADGVAEYNNIPVYSNLYTGGIVGYCEKDSRLHIVNCKNSGNLSRRTSAEKPGDGVSLKAYLESHELLADTKELGKSDFKISIGGGIIGANLENQVIDHCVNTGTMSGFIGLGGIVGFNAGGVFNCQLSDNFGNMQLDYIGGIAGLNVHAGSLEETESGGQASGSVTDQTTEGKNKEYKDVNGREWKNYTSGTIAMCSTGENRTVSGRRFVGGIVGYNLSGAQLKADVNRANVLGAEDYVGGMAGANSGSIWIAQSSGGEEYTINGNNGEGIGGIVGWNKSRGSIDVTDTSEMDDADGSGSTGTGTGSSDASSVGADGEIIAVNTNVSVTGKEKVGGIVGIQEGRLGAFATDSASDEDGAVSGNGKILYLVSKAGSVHATEGYAGGVIGEARISQAAEDTGDIIEAGAQGGKILRAVNRSIEVTADSGPAGGIVAVNQQGFLLEECRNLGNVNSDQGYAGGIAAENYGMIHQCQTGSTKEHKADSKNGAKETAITIRSQGVDAIGGICGVNYGWIWDSAPVKYEDKGVAYMVALSGTAKIVGGVAGINAAGGHIGLEPVLTTEAENQQYVMTYMPAVEIRTSDLTVGGVAGQNQSAQGDNEQAGAGKQAAEIQNIRAEGLSFEGFNNYQYLGGIAGENQDGAKVTDCAFASGIISQTSGTKAGNCYGGIAGSNSGSLLNCEIKGIKIEVLGVYTATNTNTAKEKESLSSHVGGVAGKNEESGLISGCLIAEDQAADGIVGAKKANNITVANGMAGGVAGYNKGKMTLSGDAVTAELMGQGTGADGSTTAGVFDVDTLVANAVGKVIADANYVNWDTNNVDIEKQTYNTTKTEVSANRNLILMMTTNGNLGGITAYNAPTGEINYCATGNWFLNNKSEAIGVGTGGIIGMNESEKDLAFLLNQAFVGRQLAKGTTDRFAGGIIGSQNNTISSDWTISNCVNYGTIYCRNTHYSGGIIGQWTGTGGNIEKCRNYGNLQTTYGTGWLGASGGIVAQLYHAYEKNEYNIVSCGNYGNVFGQNGTTPYYGEQKYKNGKWVWEYSPNCANDSAGILGNVTAYKVNNSASAQKFTINVVDCVNGAGVEIYSGSMASGIVGFLSCNDADTVDNVGKSTANIILNIERCRNYASTLYGLQFVAGIFGDRYGENGSKNTTLKYCFSLDYTEYRYGANQNPNQTPKPELGNLEPRPVVSYKSAGSNVGQINNGTNGVYNYFLGNRDGITSFFDGTQFWSITGSITNQEYLRRVNSAWVYSIRKGNTRYFVYVKPKENKNDYYEASNWNVSGNGGGNKVKFGDTLHKYGDKIYDYAGNEIGYILFAINNQKDAGTYSDMASIVEKGSDFDQYVREFCFNQAGLLLAPEKAVLSKSEDDQFLLEVDNSIYTDADKLEYIAKLHRRDIDGKEEDITNKVISLNGNTLSNVEEFIFSSEKCTFEVEEGELKKGGEVFVRLKARQKDSSMESTEIESNPVPIGSALPDPKLRIELVKVDGTYQYRFRLANQSAYSEYADKSLKVHVRLMNQTEPLQFAVGDSIIYDKLTGNSLQQLVVWLTEESTQDNQTVETIVTSEVSVPVYLPRYMPSISLKNEAVVATPSCQVSGTSLKDLSITVTLTGTGNNVTTPPIYRAELISSWKENPDTPTEIEHIDVLQTADILTVANGEAKAVFTDFMDNNAETFTDATDTDIGVRVWYAQSGLGPVYTYYIVGKNELSNTRSKEVEDDGTETAVWKDAYTSVLAETDFANYRWSSEKLFTWLPVPVLMKLDEGKSLKPGTDPNNGHLTYTFEWDKDIVSNTNKYIVTLTGTTKDEKGNPGTPVSIETDREVIGGSLTLDAEDWPYEEVEISVTRVGENTATSIQIGKTTTKSYAVKKRLPQPAQPTVGLKDQNTDELFYEVKWSRVTPEVTKEGDTEPVQWSNGCDYYEIYIRPSEPDPDDAEDFFDRIRVNVWEQDADTSDFVQSITEDGIYVKEVNLEKYAGRSVLISIQAYPKDDDEVYVYSVDGITYELKVPDRIDAPVINDWEKNWNHRRDEWDNAKSIEEFEKGETGGLKVTLTADNNSIPPGGSSYLLKAYIFETAEDAKAAMEEDAEPAETLNGYLATYRVDENGNFTPEGMEAEENNKYAHTLKGLSADYAGKYILFYARISSGGGNVSSKWVVNDNKDDGTDDAENGNDAVWRLPYVKLPTPEVTARTSEREVMVTLTTNPDLNKDSVGTGQSVKEKEPAAGDQPGDELIKDNLIENDLIENGPTKDELTEDKDGESKEDKEDTEGGETSKKPGDDQTNDTDKESGDGSGDGDPSGDNQTGTDVNDGQGIDGSEGSDNTGDNTDSGAGDGTDTKGDNDNSSGEGQDTTSDRDENGGGEESAGEGDASKNASMDKEPASVSLVMAACRVSNTLAGKETVFARRAMTAPGVKSLKMTVDILENQENDESEDEEENGRTAGENAENNPEEESSEKSAEEQAEKLAEESAEKSSEKSDEASTEESAKKSVKKSAGKSVDKAEEESVKEDLTGNDIAFPAEGTEEKAKAEIKEEMLWSATATTLSWSSVTYADSYYFVLTDDDENDRLEQEFKIVENQDLDNPDDSTAQVYRKNDDGNWEEITQDETDNVYKLFEDGKGYGREVEGSYILDAYGSTLIPYTVTLGAELEISRQDGVFIYTLTLPDSTELTPPSDSGYQNSIENGDNNKLCFTDSVRIWADLAENEEEPYSKAYVHSKESSKKITPGYVEDVSE